MLRRRSNRLLVLLIFVLFAVQGSGEGVTVLHPETRISLSDGHPGEKLGFDVAGDGDTFIASTSPYISTDKTAAVYVYVRSEDNQWLQQAKLILSAERRDDELGSIDISKNTIVVTEPNFGNVYIFAREGNAWVQQAKLSSPASSGLSFGRTVAIDGDTVVVGDEGAVHVYVRQPGTANWSYQAKLTAPGDYKKYYAFGPTVDISGNTIVVGIGKYRGGSASVFVRHPGTTAWVQQTELVPIVERTDLRSDFVLVKSQQRLSGSCSVSIDSDRIVVGSCGESAVYLFERSSTKSTWTQTARLVPQGGRRGFLAPYGFGIETAIQGNVIAVLAKDYSSLFSGVEAPVYLFGRSEDGQWMQQAKVLPLVDFPDEHGFFSIALWNNRLAAGEIFAKNEQGVIGGAVHILDISAVNLQLNH